MHSVRRHGNAPYSIVMLHGGPGACGEMAQPARELCALTGRGVLETQQCAHSINAQVEELAGQLKSSATAPVTLAAYSWGAWLALIFCARHPQLVKKLLLISCGPLEQKYAAAVESTRMSRLDSEQQRDWAASLKALGAGVPDSHRKILLHRLHELTAVCDCFDPLPPEDANADAVDFRSDIFEKVWPEACELRRSGELLECARRIVCPVTALHGNFDPHPSEGVRKPLSELLQNFKFIELENCGHVPWRERRAHDEFMRLLSAELA